MDELMKLKFEHAMKLKHGDIAFHSEEDKSYRNKIYNWCMECNGPATEDCQYH